MDGSHFCRPPSRLLEPLIGQPERHLREHVHSSPPPLRPHSLLVPESGVGLQEDPVVLAAVSLIAGKHFVTNGWEPASNRSHLKMGDGDADFPRPPNRSLDDRRGDRAEEFVQRVGERDLVRNALAPPTAVCIK